MIKEIEFDNTTIKYDLQYKNVKNINLRIKPDGSINISANERVPQRIIEEFIISKWSFIIRSIQKYRNMTFQQQHQYFSESEIKEQILRICEAAYPYFKSRGIMYPEIKFRKMVSRWGSCHSQKGILTFNTNLMYAPVECIEYVVLHEFTHFLQPNHSSKFYEELAKTCPDWKELRKKLKEIYIP
ncbi:MAG: DUF45 domain-containing protein [Clostridia bacterium]|nr:DUF45 domain-containing protein [Clostridia bacterium]